MAYLTDDPPDSGETQRSGGSPGHTGNGYSGDSKCVTAEQEHNQDGPVIGQKVFKYKMALTVSMVVLYVTIGLFDQMFGLALSDLRDRLSVTTDTITLARSVKNIGWIIGGVLGGILSDLHKDRMNAFMATNLILSGVAVLCTPWSSYVQVFGCISFVEGLVGNAYVMNLWGVKADPAMHSIHLGHTVGMTLAPILVVPFLSPDQEDCVHNDTEGMDNCTQSTRDFVDESNFEIPFVIGGGFSLVIGLVFIFFTFCSPPAGYKLLIPSKTSLKEIFLPGTCAGGRAGLGAVLVGLLVLCYALNMAQYLSFYTLHFTYMTESDLDFSKPEAALVDLSNKICFLVSGMVSTVLARFVGASYIMFISVGATAISLALISLLGVQSRTMYWVFQCFYAFSMGPTWASAYAFIDKYIILYSFVVALTAVGSGLSGFAFQPLIGYLYEVTVKESFLYLATAVSFLWFLDCVCMQLVALRLGRRHEKETGVEDTIGSKNEQLVFEKEADIVTKF